MIEARIRKHFPQGRESAGFSLDVEFEAGPGVTVLFGASGAGKTLTLDSIAGFVKPDEGRILLDDVILFDAVAGVNLPPRERRCGYVFQNYALFPHMTLRENLTFAAGGWPRAERRRKVNEVLERFRLADIAGRMPYELSGGQKQRGSIARALVGGGASRAGGTRILLLDEPAQGLDAPLREEFYAVLRQVKAEFGIPALLVTHSLEECCALADYMHVVSAGRLARSGKPREVIEEPSTTEVARLLGLYNLIPAEVRALDPGRNRSRLKLGEFEVEARYLPGRLIGDRVTVYVRPAELHASPKDGRPGPNQLALVLRQVVDLAGGVRLEFEGGIAVEMSCADYSPGASAREWLVEFPPSSLRVL
jgi:molybdate transport system ATP-binding protein